MQKPEPQTQNYERQGNQQHQEQQQRQSGQQQSQRQSNRTQQEQQPAQLPVQVEYTGTNQEQQEQQPNSFGLPTPTPQESRKALAPRPLLVDRALTMAAGTSSTVNLKRTSSFSASNNQLNVATGPPEEVFSLNPEDYELKDIIGYGGSSVVHTATYKPLNKNVAVKIIDLDKFERDQIDELRRETQVMSLCRHPHLLRVYGSFVTGSKLYIVTPFFSAGSCLDILKVAYPKGMDEVSIATILKQALLGLDYLHKNGHIHRDVKAGNLLMDEDGHVLLADFGVSSSLHDHSDRRGRRKTFVGTPCWMAPEVMEQSGYDYKADIWSFGITAFELATGHAPFSKYPPLKVVMLTLSNDPPTLDRDRTKHKYSKAFKEVIDMCLQKDPSKRPTAERLLQHPFFKQAKKRNHLVSLIQNLPPIQDRPLKKQQPKSASFSKGVSWDFSGVDEDEDYRSEGSDSSERSADRSDERFSDRAADVEDASSERSRDDQKVSFGDETGDHDSARSSLSGEESNMLQSRQPPPQQHQGQQELKRSRFMVDTHGAFVSPSIGVTAGSGMPPTSGDTPQVTSATGSPLQHLQQPQFQSAQSGLSSAGSVPISQQQPQQVEVRRGRFSVGPATGVQQGTGTAGSSDSSPGTAHSSPVNSSSYNQYGGGREKADSLDFAGNRSDAESCLDRKSRFHVEPASGQAPGCGENQIVGSTAIPALPLSRMPSVGSASFSATTSGSVVREPSVGRVGRFGVESASGSGSAWTDATGGQGQPLGVGMGAAKRGRFSVSSVETRIEPRTVIIDGQQATALSYDMGNSPGSVQPSPASSRPQAAAPAFRFDAGVPVGVLHAHLENLVRQSDAQRAALCDFMYSLGIGPQFTQTKWKPGGELHGLGSVAAASGTGTIPREAPSGGSPFRGISADVSTTLAILDRQIQTVMRENDALRRENDYLRRELERGRRPSFSGGGSLPAGSVNAAGSPSLLREIPAQTTAVAGQTVASVPSADSLSPKQEHQQQQQPPAQQQPQQSQQPQPVQSTAQQASAPRDAAPLMLSLEAAQ